MFHSMNTSKEDTKPESSLRVEEPDEAKYNFSDEKGVWQPEPKEILRLFQELSNGDPLPLKWTCPGRRPPQKDTNTEENVTEGNEEDEDESMEEETKAPETSAFDFDEPQTDMNNSVLIPRRAPGGIGRTPRTEKRVARMDNIMNSLQKQQMQRAAEREARKVKGMQSGTPPGRSRLLNFGSLGPKRLNAGSDSPGRGTPPTSFGGNTAVSSTVSASATTSDTLTHTPANNTPTQATGNEPKLQASSTMLPSTTAAPITSTSDNTLNPSEQTAPGKNTSLTAPTTTMQDEPSTATSNTQENTTSSAAATISNTLQTSQSNTTSVVSTNQTPTPATSPGLTTAPQSVAASSTETISQSEPVPSVSASDSLTKSETTDAPYKTVSSSTKPTSSDSADQNQSLSGAEGGAKLQSSTASSNSDLQESSKPTETTGPEADKSMEQDQHA